MPFSVFRLALPSVRPPSAFPTPTLGFKSKVFAVSAVFAAVFFTEGVFDPKKANGKTVKNASSMDAFFVRPILLSGRVALGGGEVVPG